MYVVRKLVTECLYVKYHQRVDLMHRDISMLKQQTEQTSFTGVGLSLFLQNTFQEPHLCLHTS